MKKRKIIKKLEIFKTGSTCIDLNRRINTHEELIQFDKELCNLKKTTKISK